MMMNNILALIGTILIVLLGVTLYAIRRVYASLRQVEQEVVDEVSRTKKHFQQIVTGLLVNPNEDVHKKATRKDAESVVEHD